MDTLFHIAFTPFQIGFCMKEESKLTNAGDIKLRCVIDDYRNDLKRGNAELNLRKTI